MRVVAVAVAVAVVGAAALVATRSGMWRHAVVQVTGVVSTSFAFDEHSAGPSPRPCRDSVTGGQRPAFELPTWAGFMQTGRHTIEYFGGRTATSDATRVGIALPIDRAGTYGGAASVAIDGHGYTLLVGTVTIRPDGSGSATLGGNGGDQLPRVVTVTARVDWTCRDGLLPV